MINRPQTKKSGPCGINHVFFGCSSRPSVGYNEQHGKVITKIAFSAMKTYSILKIDNRFGKSDLENGKNMLKWSPELEHHLFRSERSTPISGAVIVQLGRRRSLLENWPFAILQEFRHVQNAPVCLNMWTCEYPTPPRPSVGAFLEPMRWAIYGPCVGPFMAHALGHSWPMRWAIRGPCVGPFLNLTVSCHTHCQLLPSKRTISEQCERFISSTPAFKMDHFGTPGGPIYTSELNKKKHNLAK